MTYRSTASDLARRFAPLLTAAGLALALVSGGVRAAAPPVGAPDDAAASRIVGIADIHGAFDELTGILRTAGLVDDRHRWIGGNAVLVQTGDYFDRGLGVREAMNLLMALEREAPRAGGRALVLLGNHEVMNLVGRTRDVNPDLYAKFADGDSEKRREKAWAAFVKLADARAKLLGSRPKVYDVTREDWMAAHPPGLLEYMEAISPNGTYGRWLRRRPAVVNVDGTVFMHAGLDPATAPDSLDDVNDEVHGDIEAFDGYRRYLVDSKIILPFFTLPEVLAAAQAEAVSLAALVSRAKEGDTAAADWLRSLNPRHVDVIRGVLDVGNSSLLSGDGPMWFRGFAQWSDEEGPALIQTLLDKYRVERFVTGHTVQSPSRVNDRFGGRVFLIDTGMLSSTYTGGRASALEITGGAITAVYTDSTAVLQGGGR